MKKTLLSILACPCCQGQIELKPKETIENGEVISGTLQCLNCWTEFSIYQGVPCMLPREQQIKSSKGFTEQWKYRFSGEFETNYLYGLNPTRRIENATAKFVDPIQADEWILDAGCGSAEMTFAAANNYPQAQIVGLELSEAIRLAAKEAGSFPNLHFVQGDVMNPPFKQLTFSKVYSMGVLHHTSNTKAAFDSISSLVLQYGNLVIWLYPDPIECPANIPYYGIRDIVFLGMGHKVPPELCLWLVKFYTGIFLPFIIISQWLGKEFYHFSQKTDFLIFDKESLSEIYEATAFINNLTLLEMFNAISFWIFDDVTPEFQFRHKRQEVINWFKENRFDEAHADTIGTYWGKRWH
ncbi:MAG: methyltransferase domain-containing protein [Nostoc sp.]|uniref:methyltransferase domain-containing protein n=1 Tax=Nostoc sp. TaxID=1180 RepID=UPI002FFC5561